MPKGRDEGLAPIPNDKLPIKMGKTENGVSGRVSSKLRTLLEHMAYRGASLPVAAEAAGMEIRSAKHALRKKHVKNALNQLIADIRNNAGQQAYLRINHMSEAASSEHVKLEANKWVAGVDGISPVQKVAGQVQHTVAFKGFGYAGPKPKDITPGGGDADT